MKKLSDCDNIAQRQNLLKEILGHELSEVEASFIDKPENVHCENLIGAVTIPVGVAGPLKINGEHVNKEVYVPLATTEGALVASVNRGAKAVGEASGAAVWTQKHGATRGPVFYIESVQKRKEFIMWLDEHIEDLEKVAAQTSHHLTLLDQFVRSVGRYVYVRWSFDTEDAMGMNMATIASQALCDYIKKEQGVDCLSLAGNFDVDKKPAGMNMLLGRGFHVHAEAVIPFETCMNVLKNSPEHIFDVWLGKCMIGSAMSQSYGYNSHFSNIVAAFYAATGQDLAHVVEGSLGITTTKVVPHHGLYISVDLPAVMIATVGGGTGLVTQSELRNMLGVTTSVELAEILGGAVLAGELSLLASLAQGTLSKAHTLLGR